MSEKKKKKKEPKFNPIAALLPPGKYGVGHILRNAGEAAELDLRIARAELELWEKRGSMLHLNEVVDEQHAIIAAAVDVIEQARAHYSESQTKLVEVRAHIAKVRIAYKLATTPSGKKAKQLLKLLGQSEKLAAEITAAKAEITAAKAEADAAAEVKLKEAK
jgi:hypothetical protein